MYDFLLVISSKQFRSLFEFIKISLLIEELFLDNFLAKKPGDSRGDFPDSDVIGETNSVRPGIRHRLPGTDAPQGAFSVKTKKAGKRVSPLPRMKTNKEELIIRIDWTTPIKRIDRDKRTSSSFFPPPTVTPTLVERGATRSLEASSFDRESSSSRVARFCGFSSPRVSVPGKL